MAEQNGSKKWDAKTVIIAGLITMLPVTVGLTYNITDLVLSRDVSEFSKLSDKMDALREEVYGLKMQVTRLEVKVGNP